jgi:hypothetical protein
MYQIKGYKTFKGHEGESCAQGSLYGPSGKKVAEWSDDSWGGAMIIRFNSPEEEAKFAEHAKTALLAYKDFDDKPYDPSKMNSYSLVETLLLEMSMALGVEKQELAACKKGIAFSLPAQPNQFHTWAVAYTQGNVAALRKEYPTAVILNEKYKLPLVSEAEDKAALLAAEEKRYKRACATAILYRLKKADGTEVVMKASVAYTPAHAAHLRTKHGANLLEIINERFK